MADIHLKLDLLQELLLLLCLFIKDLYYILGVTALGCVIFRFIAHTNAHLAIALKLALHEPNMLYVVE